MSKPGDRLTFHRPLIDEGGYTSGGGVTLRLEAIECPEVYRFKGHVGCRSCHGTGILWREVKDAEKKV